MSRFLLASLNIKAILQETTLHQRREKLGAMTKGMGLGDAYDATIRRIKAQQGNRGRLGIAALMWVSHSRRPLFVDELCYALAVEIGSPDINTSNVPSIRTVLSCCQGLAVIDNRSSNIRLIHFTLKEYLFGRADLFDRPHSRMAETCLTYLNSQSIKDLSVSPSRDPRDPPFLKYSSLYWGTHMQVELSDRSRSLALDLLSQYDHHISAEVLWKSIVEPHFRSLRPFSALHCISYFGVAEIVVGLIRTKKWDVNQRDNDGFTPLMRAARCGHEEVVKLLLEHKCTKPDILDSEDGRTALSWAAGHGHEGVVRLFLAKLFVNPQSIGRRWVKAPQRLSVLLGRKYINPDRPDNYGETPISWAARNGQDGVVQLLLEQEDAIPDRPDYGGQTPLSWAAVNGHDGVVKLLLGRKDVNPDRPDNDGQTPLSWAAWNGHDGVVRLLLAREDVSPDWPGNPPNLQLPPSTKNGPDGIVNPLLEEEDVGPNGLRNMGQTPLSLAARNGHDGVVKLLMGLEAVGFDKPDNYGQTPLSWAACNGHDGAVKLLLERRDVNPDKLDNYGRTPLSWAAKNGHDGAVKLLLEREDVTPGRPDNCGRTPVSLAARNGHGGVVELLKARGAAAPIWYRPWRYDASLRLLA